MVNFLKNIYYNTWLGKMVYSLMRFVTTRLITTKTLIRWQYKKVFGKYPDLKNPQSLNEKINWLKLHDRDPLLTQCADKFAVREIIANKVGSEYLVPLYFQSTKANDLHPDFLPEVPCIVKTNHDSGGGVFIMDKNRVDWKEIRKQFTKRLKKNYYWRSKEWQYKNIVPRIIVEKLLLDDNGNIPMDYKVHCFNKKVRMIQVDIGRDTEYHFRNWYSRDWQREPYKWSSVKGKGKFTDPSPEDIEKPATLEKMIELSEILAEPFDYVRVDWYDLNGNLYFGELTFHHDSGLRPILPYEWDLKLGALLKLNKN